ncbi:hypothetical protein ACJJIU_03560 [Microbulbifer sp. CnH-101-E]|uniref:hypothetical protein n=1 Tax=unclassified Microbulbifer TaxID=2619833 RepID=UPI004039ACD9
MAAKRWLLDVCLLLLAGSVFADFKKGIAAWAVKDGDLTRLECYDQLGCRSR